MIVTKANDLASKIHDGMPVLLQLSDFDGWLAGNAGSELLKPAANDYLQDSSRAAGDDPTADCCTGGQNRGQHAAVHEMSYKSDLCLKVLKSQFDGPTRLIHPFVTYVRNRTDAE